MQKIYIVELIGWGHIEQLAYFSEYQKALNFMKTKVRECKAAHRADKTLAKAEDLERGIRNGAIEYVDREKVDPLSWDSPTHAKATVSYFYKCSYEYDEWDLGGDTFRVIEANLM